MTSKVIQVAISIIEEKVATIAIEEAKKEKAEEAKGVAVKVITEVLWELKV